MRLRPEGGRKIREPYSLVEGVIEVSQLIVVQLNRQYGCHLLLHDVKQCLTSGMAA